MGARAVSLTFAPAPLAAGTRAVLPFGDAARAVVSWNSRAAAGELSIRALGADGSRGERLRLAHWSPAERRSFSERDALVEVEVDVVHARAPLAALEIETSAPLELLALATPEPERPPRPPSGRVFELAVPARSQYPADPAALPPELAASARGWCSAASLAMVLAYLGRNLPLEEVAAGVYDSAYGGTGNWAFNVAFAGELGFRAYAAYLRDLRAAEGYLASGTPLALSFDWRPGELPGAPLTESAGHFAVLRGMNANGDPLMTDPAISWERTVYPRNAFESIWRRHGGLAYIVTILNDGHAPGAGRLTTFDQRLPRHGRRGLSE